jgi:hypothetical protein
VLNAKISLPLVERDRNDILIKILVGHDTRSKREEARAKNKSQRSELQTLRDQQRSLEEREERVRE